MRPLALLVKPALLEEGSCEKEFAVHKPPRIAAIRKAVIDVWCNACVGNICVYNFTRGKVAVTGSRLGEAGSQSSSRFFGTLYRTTAKTLA